MRANVGDQLVVRSQKIGKSDRNGRIIEVRGPDGAPPYVVEWSDDGRIGTFFPGPDALVQPAGERRPDEGR
ncbi:MAG TPA: DUF1918 domain-containing protein [Acidimicrobiales bacterium]|nr:DUF1918 domain-containing protein [Acidimicrobiales bacterium]